MSNETKRDVFEEALSPYKDGDVWHNKYLAELRVRYDAALPDDLPVIPKTVGEYIRDAKAGHNGIGFVLMMGGHAMTTNRIAFEEWLTRVNNYSDRIDRENTFARSWLLGIWRVEENGEIVKLEATK